MRHSYRIMAGKRLGNVAWRDRKDDITKADLREINCQGRRWIIGSGLCSVICCVAFTVFKLCFVPVTG